MQQGATRRSLRAVASIMAEVPPLDPKTLESLGPGVVVGGAYRLTRALGSDALARVWEAEQLRLGGRVAIKFLDASLLQDDNARARFEREARAVCEVRSPYIVQIQDHGVEGDVPFLIMELLEGEDLDKLLAREHALELGETAEIVGQLCRALDKAHRAGFVHRNVKPENIFVIQESDGSRFIKLLDFGFVKQLGADGLTVTSDGVIGTPQYVSPEQIARPALVDARADTWAVGVTAYRMLVGRLPFGSPAPGEIAAMYDAILTGRYTRATELRPELPKEIDDWFAQLLAVEPEQRYPSLRAASAALLAISRPRALDPVDAVQMPAPARLSSTTQRRSRVLPRTAIAIACIAVAISLWTWVAQDQRRRSRPIVQRKPPVAAAATSELSAAAAPVAAPSPVVVTGETIPSDAGSAEPVSPLPTRVSAPPRAAVVRRAAANKVKPVATEPVAAPAPAPSSPLKSALPKDRGF